MTFQWWRVSQRGRITLDCGYAKSGDLISDFILMHCDVEGSVWGSAENQSGVSWNRLHSVFPWYLQHQQPPGRTAEGRRLHNSVVQRGRRGQVMRVKTWGGSEFLPHQRCFGMKQKHGLLPDHIAFSAASTHPDRMRSAPKLVGCQTLVVSLSSRHHV